MAGAGHRHISGYSGHIPGDKYKFGSRTPRASPRLPPLHNGYRNGIGYNRPRSSVNNGQGGPQRLDRTELANTLHRSKSMDTLYSDMATQYPVPVRDEAIQANTGHDHHGVTRTYQIDRQQNDRNQQGRVLQFDEGQQVREDQGAAPQQQGRVSEYSRNYGATNIPRLPLTEVGLIRNTVNQQSDLRYNDASNRQKLSKSMSVDKIHQYHGPVRDETYIVHQRNAQTYPKMTTRNNDFNYRHSPQKHNQQGLYMRDGHRMSRDSSTQCSVDVRNRAVQTNTKSYVRLRDEAIQTGPKDFSADHQISQMVKEIDDHRKRGDDDKRDDRDGELDQRKKNQIGEIKKYGQKVHEFRNSEQKGVEKMRNNQRNEQNEVQEMRKYDQREGQNNIRETRNNQQIFMENSQRFERNIKEEMRHDHHVEHDGECESQHDDHMMNASQHFAQNGVDQQIDQNGSQQIDQNGSTRDHRVEQNELEDHYYEKGQQVDHDDHHQQNQQQQPQKFVDGRIINNQQPGTLFSVGNPFGATGGNEYSNYTGVTSKYYNQNKKILQNSYNAERRTPMPGYSGHIPGMERDFGKPFSIAAHDSREREKQRLLEHMRNPVKYSPLPRHEYIQAHWNAERFK